jgi:hypothetical protein
VCAVGIYTVIQHKTSMLLPHLFGRIKQSNYVKFSHIRKSHKHHNTLLTVLFGRKVRSDCFHQVQEVDVTWKHGEVGPWHPWLTKKSMVSGSNMSRWSLKGKLIWRDLWWLLHTKCLYTVKSNCINSSPILKAIGWFVVHLDFINCVLNKPCEL